MNAWLAKLLPAALLLALAVSPAAAAPTVKDEGNLFSADIKEEANRIIADIEKRTNKQVRVEAYNQPPADKAQEFNQKKTNREFRQRFFAGVEFDTADVGRHCHRAAHPAI